MSHRYRSLLLLLCLIPSATAIATADDPFGMNIHEIQSVPEAAPATAGALIKWVRVVAWWKWMEPTRGTIDWSQLDIRVNNARSQGLEVLITFTSIPTWANGSSPTCDFWGGQCSGPLLNAGYFADFASAVASRYGNDVRYYEIWNEPDWHAFWTGSVSEWVNQILVPGSQSIRSADPDAQIVGPATYTNNSFKAWANASCGHLDVLSTHYYTNDAASMLAQADGLKTYLQGSCGGPFWVTEFGIDSWKVGEKQQAKDYVDAYAGVVARSFLHKLFLFHWDDGTPEHGGLGYGIVDRDINDFRRKRSFFEIRDYIAGRLGVPGTPLIRDTFATVAATRPDGSKLNGSSTEIGGRTWTTTSAAVVLGNALVPSSPLSATQRGGVPFDPTDQPDDPVATLEADAVMTGASEISVGFSASSTGPYTTYGQVWAELRYDGRFRVYANGSSVVADIASAPSFDAGGLNTVRLQYDSARNRVSAWINTSAVISNGSLGQFVPSISYAGFQFTGNGSGTAGRLIDNFQVSIGGDPVAPPTITFHPSPQILADGGTAHFTVQATGEGVLSYQWQRDGSNLANGGHYSGVTASSLTVSNADASVAGSYRVRVSNSGGTTTSSSALLTVQVATSCTPSSTTLCFHGNRFSARLELSGSTGYKSTFSDIAGFFYRSNQANIESAVKVIDGRGVNGKFWVFHGSLTSLPYTLTVTDTVTGAFKTYYKAANSFCGDADTSAFAGGAARVTLAGSVNAAATTCTATTTSACLLGSRFRVQVKKGVTDQKAHTVSNLTAAFTFGNTANPEVVVKVLDGTPVNGRYWVFFGSLTSQAYQVVVTDTANGTSRTYSSPGASCGQADTSAF